MRDEISASATVMPTPAQEDMPRTLLVVNGEFVAPILNGLKNIEVRNYGTNKRESISIGSACHNFGQVDVVNSLETTQAGLQATRDKHLDQTLEIVGKYDNPHQWVLAKPRWYQVTVPYTNHGRHWVILNKDQPKGKYIEYFPKVNLE